MFKRQEPDVSPSKKGADGRLRRHRPRRLDVESDKADSAAPQDLARSGGYWEGPDTIPRKSGAHHMRCLPESILMHSPVIVRALAINHSAVSATSIGHTARCRGNSLFA